MSFKTGASAAALALALGVSAALAQQTPPSPPAAKPAAPVSGQLLTQPDNTLLTRDLIGQTVLAPDNAKIGSISELILTRDGKTVEGFVIGVGGFLGIGERSVALKMDQLQIAMQPDGSVKLTSDVKKDDLANAPAFKTRKDIENEKRAAERPTTPAPGPRPNQSGSKPAQ
jgi:PRC-barrel domain